MYVGDGVPQEEDELLAIALGAGESDRRILPDRRTGIERRKGWHQPPGGSERRTRADRRTGPRRAGELPGGLLQLGAASLRRSASPSERQTARNEALWREVNDRIDEIDATMRILPDDLLEFHCECGRRDCDSRISMTPSEYRDVRRQRDTFTLAKGHESEVIEHVVTSTDRYIVVDKLAIVEAEVGADGIPRSGA